MAWPQRIHQRRVSWLSRWQTPQITTPLRVGSTGQSGVGIRLEGGDDVERSRSGKPSCSGLGSLIGVRSIST